MSSEKQRSVDPAAQQMLNVARQESREVAYDRYEAMQPQCGYGQLGICCTNCNMGPCRIDPFGEGPLEGICGATAEAKFQNKTAPCVNHRRRPPSSMMPLTNLRSGSKPPGAIDSIQ